MVYLRTVRGIGLILALAFFSGCTGEIARGTAPGGSSPADDISHVNDARDSTSKTGDDTPGPGPQDGSISQDPDAVDDPRDPQEPRDPDGVYVVLLVTEESEAAHAGWMEILTDAGLYVSADHSLAGQAPGPAELEALAQRFDVALLTHQASVTAYSSPAWNDLAIGLVTTRAHMASEDKWHWLDVGTADPTEHSLHQLTVDDPHGVLYGLPLGHRARLELMDETEAAVHGYLRESNGTTDMGTVALRAPLNAVSDSLEPLVLWEPGPYFSTGDQHAGARRALFGVGNGEGQNMPALNEEGKRLLVQVLEWAARQGYPRRREATFDPVGIMLTWQNDPTTTMTIDFHTLPTEERPSEVRYWADGAVEKNTATGTSFPFPHSDRTIHRVELTELAPDTVYLFDFGEDSRIFQFRTMPATLDRPLHFITGGDVRHSVAMMQKTSAEAHRHSPAFITWGGDLAYVDGNPERVGRWHDWFATLKSSLVNSEGRVVPVLASIGNHEVQAGYFTNHDGYEPTDAWRLQIAPFFYSLFAFPGQPGYNVIDFGDYMSWIILDTQHTNPIGGAQTAWLKDVLEARPQVPHIFPLYHVPAFPSHRTYESTNSRRVRENFLPLFEASQIKIAFENHDHTYKRTEPIRNGAVAADGIVYLGDGAWGVSTREPRTPEEEWYLNQSRSVRHFIVGTISGEGQQTFRAFDEDGRLFDSVTR